MRRSMYVCIGLLALAAALLAGSLGIEKSAATTQARFAAIGFVENNNMLALSATGQAWWSSNLGFNWEPRGTASGAVGEFVRFEIISTSPVVAITNEGEAWHGEHPWYSWWRVGQIATDGRVVDLVLWRQTNDFFALTDTGEVWRSNNLGVTWFLVGIIPGGSASITEGRGNPQPSTWGRIKVGAGR